MLVGYRHFRIRQGRDLHESEEAWEHALAVTRPALLLAAPSYVDDIVDRLRESGLHAAIRDHNTASVVDWLLGANAFQGVSDAAASAFDAVHGGVSFSEIDVALSARPPCPLLRGYWTFSGCGYRKGSARCTEPMHQPLCPLPGYDLRKGALNIAAHSLFFFARDICGGDIVAWIDARLANADRGHGMADRAVIMRRSLVEPLSSIAGFGPKIVAMALADLLLGCDRTRERWVTTGASMIAIDSLIHNYLHRTGILRRLKAEHPYGSGCYEPDGCVAVIEGLAARFDARQINPAFTQIFPRFYQHALWRFCATAGRNICNGAKIDDRGPCRLRFCPAGSRCDRVALR